MTACCGAVVLDTQPIQSNEGGQTRG